MARIEQSSGEASSPEVLEAIKRLERKPTKVIHHRPLFGGCGCCSGSLGIFIILGLLVLGVVARTGLVQIPVVSRVVYRQPAPSRIVAPTTTAALVPQRTADGRYQVTLTEGDLTATVQQTFATMNESNQLATFETGQVAINGDTIEIFATFSRPAGGSAMMQLMPIVIDHQLQFQLEQLRLGALALPRWLGGAKVEQAMNAQISEVFAQIPFQVDSLAVRAGAIDVLLSPVVPTAKP
ncbi:MAG: hypothetical protein AAB817_01685 [Patescibacteria group bacterium]|mgnify:CR=1 FL=1